MKGHTLTAEFAHDHSSPFNVDGKGPYCNDTSRAGDYVAVYNGATTDSPALPDTQSTAFGDSGIVSKYKLLTHEW